MATELRDPLGRCELHHFLGFSEGSAMNGFDHTPLGAAAPFSPRTHAPRARTCWSFFMVQSSQSIEPPQTRGNSPPLFTRQILGHSVYGNILRFSEQSVNEAPSALTQRGRHGGHVYPEPDGSDARVAWLWRRRNIRHCIDGQAALRI